MSKRSSKNAINFAGKNWGMGRKFKTKKSKKEKKKEKKKEIRDRKRKRKFDLICRKFGFKISSIQDKRLYETLLNEFLELRAMEGSRIAQNSLVNVDYFKIYCEKYGEKFDIQVYFQKKFNKIDFRKKYPNIFVKENTTEKENNSHPFRPNRKKNSLENLISDEMAAKLKQRFRK